jgi:cephalosporin hydroxylase
MNKIKEKYDYEQKNISDINEHISTLYEYGLKCSHITEMGVRWVSSTWAFLYSNPNKLISYDIVKDANVNEVISLSKEYGINYEFIESDVLNINIEQTDLLFIDTLHTYNQLLSELKLHSTKVNKYIILHDTVSYGQIDEQVYNHASPIVKNMENNKTGLTNAINDFLLLDVGKTWFVSKEFKNNNGLTVLEKKI